MFFKAKKVTFRLLFYCIELETYVKRSDITFVKSLH